MDRTPPKEPEYQDNNRDPNRSAHDGRCLDYHTGTGNVFLTSCHGRANQEWYFDGMTLKSKFDDKCLDYNQVGSGGSVYMYDCHGGDHQNWRFDGKTLKTLYAENCVDYNYKSHDAYVLECHGESWPNSTSRAVVVFVSMELVASLSSAWHREEESAMDVATQGVEWPTETRLPVRIRVEFNGAMSF